MNEWDFALVGVVHGLTAVLALLNAAVIQWHCAIVARCNLVFGACQNNAYSCSLNALSNGNVEIPGLDSKYKRLAPCAAIYCLQNARKQTKVVRVDQLFAELVGQLGISRAALGVGYEYVRQRSHA